jgi:hypothetical protein
MFKNVLSFSYLSFVINVIPYCCIFRSALSDEKRRLDARINELEEELEEERAQNEMLEEKAKRSQIAVNFCFYFIFLPFIIWLGVASIYFSLSFHSNNTDPNL